MGNKEQIYGRNDMVLLDKHNKIYGSLGIVEPYVFDTKTGETIVMENPKKGKFEDAVTEFNVYGKSTQVTTTGAQLFDVDAGGTGWLNQETGEFEKSQANYVSDFIPIKPNTAYYCNYDISYNVRSYTKDKIHIKKENWKGSFVTGSDVAFMRFAISSGPSNALQIAKKIMLCEGNTAKPYEPYTGGKPSPSIEYPQEIVSVGDDGDISVDVYGGNLLKIPDFENADVKITNEKEVIIVEKKTNTEGDIYRGKGFELNLTAGKYVLDFDGFTEHSFTKEGHRVQIQLDGKPIASASYPSGSTKSFTLKKNSTIRVVIFTGYAEANKKYKIKGLRINREKSIPFEPYKEPQTLTLSTPNGLLGIPVSTGGNYTDSKGQQWVCDEIDLARGKYVQRIAENVWDTVSFTDTGSGKFQNNTLGAYKLKGATFASMGNFARYSAWANESGGFAAFDKYFYYHHGSEIKVEELNELFNSKAPIKIIGQLETPIERDLTPEEITAYKALHTNYPITTIVNDENARMKVTYKQLESKTKAVN